MAEKIINVAGKDITFTATAATPRKYRNLFKRDLFKDLTALYKKLEAIEKSKKKKKDELTELEQFEVMDLELFENMAFTMAVKDKIYKNTDEWFEQFEIFDINNILPEIMELWSGNINTTEAGDKDVKK